MRVTPEEMVARTDRRDEHGPFDIVGDVHGCYDEVLELLGLLGYQHDETSAMRHPLGRRVIFVGDLVDRGPKIVEAVTLARRMVEAGQAFCVTGNHDNKLLRYLRGHSVQISHGLDASIAQIEALPEGERADWVAAYDHFLGALGSHLVLDGGHLVVAHAGIREADQGGDSPRIRAFTLYGLPTGEKDVNGLPIRVNWAADYTGAATVVYGHTPVTEPVWQNNTINIDTGCVFGGRLTALRWPERTLVSVPARRVYAMRGK
jgi:diadenosine tetraphosphatase ApaH/serine/threonine PP2A family protein phosphatase